jgi:hypothetical protein
MDGGRQLVAFGDNVDVILVAREFVAKQAALKVVLRIEVIRGDSAVMVGHPDVGHKIKM